MQDFSLAKLSGTGSIAGWIAYPELPFNEDDSKA
jgi:hypothetical protein